MHHTQIAYRPDLDGLRAVAILAVLAYHVGIPGTSGGFIGVDVFFVVSGFLITTLLLRERTESGRVDLVRFYARRMRRLLPAALVVIVVTAAGSAVVISPFRIDSVSWDAASSALYVANVRYAMAATDYLADTSFLSPYLHFWSLAVEEQFYLVWPVVAIAAARLGRSQLKWLIVVIAAVSFTASLAATQSSAPVAFYSLHTRAWELAAGAFLAVAVVTLSSRLSSIVTWIGLSAIGIGVIAIGPATTYPGWAALLPTIGAFMVIVGGNSSSNRLLASSPARWLGGISYSLYLWHWPILVLVPIAIGIDGLWLRVLLACGSVLVAAASTRFVEQPFRTGRLTLPGPVRVVRVGLIASVAVSVAVISLPVAYSFELHPEARALIAIRHDSTTNSDCNVRALEEVEPIGCSYGAVDSNRTVVLFGDSHAAQWLPALESIANRRDWRVVLHSKSACSPLVDSPWHQTLKRDWRECDTWTRHAIAAIAAVQPDAVLVGGNHRYAVATDSGIKGWRDVRPAREDHMTSMLAELGTIASHVFLIADNATLNADPFTCLTESNTGPDCETDRSRVIDSDFAALEERVAAATGAVLLPVNDWICSSESCPMAVDGTVVYRDTNHLNVAYVLKLVDELDRAMGIVTEESETVMPREEFATPERPLSRRAVTSP